MYDGEPRSALLHRRARPSAGVVVVVVVLVVTAVPLGEMATIRRDARANGDCRRLERLHAAVLAERGGSDGGTTRHRARIGASRERREPVLRMKRNAGRAEIGRRQVALTPGRFPRGTSGSISPDDWLAPRQRTNGRRATERPIGEREVGRTVSTAVVLIATWKPH